MKIIQRVEQGEKMLDVACSYNMNRSTISMILKNKEKIMEHVKSTVPRMSAALSKKQGKVMEETEKLLSVWMQDQHDHQVLLSLKLIQEKAKRLYENLKKKHCKESGRNIF